MADTDNDLKEYIQDDQPQVLKPDEEIDQNTLDQPEATPDYSSNTNTNKIKSPSKLSRLHFWSGWSKNKKIAAFGGGLLSSVLIIFLALFFIIQPSRAKSYINKSWYDVVASSSNIDRAVKSEVNLDGTRDLTKELYAYNQKLSAVSFEAKSKNTLLYKSSIINEYSALTNDLGEFFSDSANILSKTDTDITLISEDKLSDLKQSGQDLKNKVNDFRTKRGLQEEINPNLYSLDEYINEVKSKKEEIEKEKKAEEQKKKDQETKDTADKASVEALGDSYYKALINGNEAGVKATLSKGYQGEYDFESLTPARRTNFYPKSHRIVNVTKDGDNYKLTASVTYISVYQDADGNNVESVQPITEIFRVIYSTETGSWKLDGRVES